MSGTRKRVRELLDEEGINSKHLKIYFNIPSDKLNKKPEEVSKEPPKEPPKESLQNQIIELNKKFDSMINLQTKLIALLEDIDYRFNDKGQMLSYIS